MSEALILIFAPIIARALERGEIAPEHEKSVSDWLASVSETRKALDERFPDTKPEG